MARAVPLRSCDAPRSAAAPWYRRIAAGLEGKLVLCFMVLLTAALGASLWMFVSETTEALDAMADEQAIKVSRTLAMASGVPLEQNSAADLKRLCTELVQTRGIVCVAFFNTSGDLLSVAGQEPDFRRDQLTALGMLANPRGLRLAQPRHHKSPSLGPYVELTTAVSGADGKRIVGYVTVCLSQGGVDSRLRNIAFSVLLIGAVAAAVSFPLMYWLVHRVFQPIRQLVAATDLIAHGDLETRVALNRSDVIGTLARSFNEMVKRVRSQQEDLAQANGELADANARLAEANGKLSDSNRDLEEKVRQRTAQVEAAAKQLEAANRRLGSEIAEKEDFLRAVSHDLNAPLRNIAGMAATLLMKYRNTFDEEVVRRLERICKNVEVETDLIAELLELSRIKTRRQKMENVALDELLAELAELFGQDLETRQIKLTVNGPLPWIYCERARLRQVFQNLIDNAIKYMGPFEAPAVEGQAQSPAKPREISVGHIARGGEVEFYVADTGVGIAAQDLEKVFHVFRRGSGEEVQHVAGKGVGLASVKSIVETYSGTIWVESHVGRGSTFRFTINGKHVHGPSSGETPPRNAPLRNGSEVQYTCPAA
jgi:signal transduction histidine kinase